MHSGVPITLSRNCEVIEIPSGTRNTLPAGSTVRIMQTLGGSYTVTGGQYGYMYRIDARDADALGLKPESPASAQHTTFSEQLVRDELRTVFDPEIPVNIVDLGLVYGCDITPAEQGGHNIEVKMSMTAPGCGMGNVLKTDVESKLARLPDVKRVNVEIVFEPPWTPERMSEAAKLQLGFDLDFGEPSSGLPIFR